MEKTPVATAHMAINDLNSQEIRRLARELAADSRVRAVKLCSELLYALTKE